MDDLVTSGPYKKYFDNDQNVVLSARNIEGVQTALTNTINVFDLLKHNTVVVTKAAVETIEEVYA